MTPSETSRREWYQYKSWLLAVKKLQLESVFYLGGSQMVQSVPFFAQPRCWIPTPITAIACIAGCWPCVTFHQRNPLLTSTDIFDMMNDRNLSFGDICSPNLLWPMGLWEKTSEADDPVFQRLHQGLVFYSMRHKAWRCSRWSLGIHGPLLCRAFRKKCSTKNRRYPMMTPLQTLKTDK